MNTYEDLGQVDQAQMVLASTAIKAAAESAKEEEALFDIDASEQASQLKKLSTIERLYLKEAQNRG